MHQLRGGTQEDQAQRELTPEEKAQRATIPEFDSAIERNSASFPQLLKASFLKTEQFNKDPVTRLIYERYYAKLLTAFEATHGGITDSYYCSDVLAAAVLTAKDELHVVSQLGTASEPEELIFECERVNSEVRRLLKGRDLKICMAMLYSVVTYLLGALDRIKKAESQEANAVNPKVLSLLRKDLSHAKAYYMECAQRAALIEYFFGMLRGFLGLILITLAVVLAGFLSNISVHPFTPVIVSLISGAIGALISVMSRMAFGSLSLNYEAGEKIIRLLGAFRPIIGAVFGVALYVLPASGLLPLRIPDNPSQQLYFYAGIAFLAGFSERWAQDMLVVAKRRLTGSGQRADEQPVRETANPADNTPK